MKTALMDLIEWVKEQEQISLNLNDAGGLVMLALVKKKVESGLLEKERQQIIDAHFEGGKDVSTRDVDDAEQYYNSTYNTKS